MIARTMLHVEDDPQNQASLADAIAKWNEAFATEGKCFEVITAASAEAAMVAAERNRIDCALLDLRLPEQAADKPVAQTGRNLVNNLLTSRGVPMAVISGHPKDFDQESSAGGLIQTFDKGDPDGYDDAVAWLGNQWLMLGVLADARIAIERTASEVFVKRIWPQWQALLDASGTNAGRMATIVSRQYMSHAAELLGTDRPGNEPWHPFESYVVPPLLDHRAHTGDIFEIDDCYWIVLTPQCDMATGKTSTILLAHVRRGDETFAAQLAVHKDTGASNEKKQKAQDRLTKFVNQSLEPKLHFLPPRAGTNEPLLVEFGNLKIVDLAALNELLKVRVASISQPFLANLTQRFGAFISRTGQPNIDVTNF